MSSEGQLSPIPMGGAMEDIRNKHLKDKEFIFKNKLRDKEFNVFTGQLKEIQKKIEKKIGTS